jgi:adenylate kinase family enzyme
MSPQPKSKDRRIVILGNSGAGKTWLAKRLGQEFNIPVTHFDDHFWELGGFAQKRDKSTVFAEIDALARTPNWIMEGVFGELAAIALPKATLVVFLDMPWELCHDSLLRRGSQPERFDDPSRAEEGFQNLIEWAREYSTRGDLRSQKGHQALVNNAQCMKIVLNNRAGLEAALQNILEGN